MPNGSTVVDQFDDLLDQYLAAHPATTGALSSADVRFAAGKCLLMKSRRCRPLPGDSRLAAVLLVLFAETLVANQKGVQNGSMLGMDQAELFEMLESSVREGGISQDELLRATIAVDLKGHGLQLAQSNQVRRRLWKPAASVSEVREGSGSSLLSVDENHDGRDERSAAADSGLAVTRALPPAPLLQQLADDHVAARSKLSFQVVTATFACLILSTFARACVLEQQSLTLVIVEMRMLVSLPTAVFILTAATIPSVPPPAALPFVRSALLLAFAGSIQVMYMRYVEFRQATTTELVVRVGICLIFALAFLTVAVRFWRSAGTRFWADVRLALFTINVCRTVVILILRLVVGDAMITPLYPPGLRFPQALFFSIWWIVAAGAANSKVRHRFAAWTGATVVLLGLGDLTAHSRTTSGQ
jgi:hypothetical protein